MEQITLRLREETIEDVEVEAEEADTSRSEYLRDLIESRNEHDEEVARLQEEVDDLRTEVERLRSEKRQLIEDREERQELVKFAEQERDLREMEQEKQAAPVWKRAKWWVVGRDVE